ncbi:hypothetical protein ACFTAO_13150 [Paenibacillus rhizoplanae]
MRGLMVLAAVVLALNATEMIRGSLLVQLFLGGGGLYLLPVCAGEYV